MNTILNKKNIAFLALLLGAIVTLVGCNTGDTDGTVISKTDTDMNTNATAEVAEETNTNTSVEVAVNTNDTVVDEVGNEETKTGEETTSEEQLDIPEGWVKYENEEYGFAVEYSQELNLIKTHSEEHLDISYSFNDNQISFMKFKEFQNEEKITLDEWISSNVDVNDVLNQERKVSKYNVDYIVLSGASSIEDYGDYIGYHIYFMNNSADIIAIAYGIEHNIFNGTEHTFESVTDGIVNSISLLQ